MCALDLSPPALALHKRIIFAVRYGHYEELHLLKSVSWSRKVSDAYAEEDARWAHVPLGWSEISSSDRGSLPRVGISDLLLLVVVCEVEVGMQ